MPRFRNGRGRPPAPIEHLSADRLGDMVDAVRSNPPDLATLARPQAAYLEAPPVEFSPPPPLPVYEAPSVPDPPPAPEAELPAEVAPDYTWADAVPPAVPTAPDLAAVDLEVPLRELEIPGVSRPVPESRVARRRKGGRHRLPPSLKHFGRGLARSIRAALVTRRFVALVGVIGLLVVATALLGVS